MLHRDYSQLAYEDLSLDLKFVAFRYASGPVMQSRICATLWGSGKVDEEGKNRERERERETERRPARVDARVTLLSRIEKNYHIMQIRAWSETPPVRSVGPRLLATDES